ncbi:hypothetical protein M15_06310 [Atrimonas thermophila]
MSEENDEKKSSGFQQSSGNPELGWMVGCPARKHPHTFVSEGVEEVNDGHKKVEDAEFQKYPVLDEIAGGK